MSSRWYIVVLLFAVIVFSTGGSAWYFTGTATNGSVPPPKPPVGACNDNSDNTDLDNKKDEEDPGCLKPYSIEDTESDALDTDMTWVFSNGSAPNSSSPSVYKGGKTLKFFTAEGTKDSGGGGTVQERYIVPRTWAWGHQVQVQSVSLPKAGTIDPGKGAKLVTAPHATDVRFANSCGNGHRDPGETNWGCPMDMGMPDDLLSGEHVKGYGGTAQLSLETISEDVADPSVNINGPKFSETFTDQLVYEADMQGWEPFGTDTIDKSAPSGEGLQSPDKEIYKIEGRFSIDNKAMRNVPDPYLARNPSDIIKLKTFKVTQSKIGEYTDWDLKSKTATDLTETGNTIDTDCNLIGPNATCGSQGDFCTDTAKADNVADDVKKYSLPAKKQKTITATTKKYYTTGGNKPNITGETGTRQLTVKVKYHPEPTSFTWKDADGSCGNTATNAKCGCTSQTGCECTTTKPKEKVSVSKNSVNYNEPKSHTGSVYVENISFHEQNYFSTDPSQNKAPTEVPEGLWDVTDPSTDENATGWSNRGNYWSWEMEIPERYFGNSPAISSSQMKIGVLPGENKFKSVRTWYGTFDPDGARGHGDSFVSLDRGQVRVNTPVFDNESTVKSSTGRDIGIKQPKEDQGWIGPNTYNGRSCPGDSWFCVAAVDLTIKKFEEWGSPKNPGTSGVEYRDDKIYNVNESWGICRKWQKLIGGEKNSYLRCQYDNARDSVYPGGPTPYKRPKVFK